MKKNKYRELYHKDTNSNEVKINKEIKSTIPVENEKDNNEKEIKKGLIFFEKNFKNEKKKSSDE